ncbi:MAG TPA: carboxypeptidase regulatory-like domain-containing protein [Acidobacteriota bacterium]|nr:carboxypeptidase regulatory-like domain-containing protein [Acidobacteriota bacterium]
MKTVTVLVFLLLLMPDPSSTGHSQTLHATIRGQVAGDSGFPYPKVVVRATNEDTGETRQTLSGTKGEFTLSVLPPGSYVLEAELPGFRKYVRRGIEVQVGQNLRVNIVIEPGPPSEEIIVTAVQGPVEPDSTGTRIVIENHQIVNLPLDGRNFLELSLLLPGTAPAAQGSPGSVRGEFTVNVSGAREDSNNFILDGAYNNDPKLNTFAINPPVDAIREFEILTSTYDATFGRSGGAQVNVALKSGTNDFHGTAYEFFRNAALDARNFFARTDEAAPRYQRNQVGFSLGGPLRTNRTFFFSDYEGRRLNEGITQVTNVPTQLERNGDFSQSILPRPQDPFTRQPFEDGRIPSGRLSAIGVKVAALYPLPNRQVPGQNYASSPVLRDRDDRFDLRIDHALGSKSSLIGRYSFSDRDLYEPFSGPGFARIPGFGTDIPRRAQNFVIGEDQIFTPALINQVRFAFNRVAAGSYQEARESGTNRSAGLPELPSNPRDSGLSFITLSGFSPIGDEYNNPQHSVTNVFQATDIFTWSKGRHLFRSGVDYRALQQNAFRDVQSRGFLTFSNFGQITGNGLADLLLGFVTYSGGARLDNPQHLRERSLNLFLQDGYRLRRNITVQLGVRYEYNSPPVDRYDKATAFDPVTNALVPVGKDSLPRSGYESDRNNWAPRVGISWSPGTGNREVIRAGYGIYFDQSSLAPGEGLYFNKPYYDFKLYFPLPGLPLTLNSPFPADYPLTIPSSALGFDRHLRTPYVQQWNLTFERQLGVNSLVELAYVGSRGNKILSARDLNQPAASSRLPNPRPLTQFADIIFLESRGNSSYCSLQADYRQRLKDGLAALVSYTFGKSLDENSTFFSSFGDSNFPQNSADPGAEKGRSNFDARHRFSMGYSYDIPIGRGRRLLGGAGPVSALLAGWSTHGIVTLQSGRPFTVELLPEIDNSNTGIASLGFGANNRPNRIATGRLQNRGPEGWFDTGAFAIAPYGSFGNSGRNILDGPGYADVSVSLIKGSRIRENLNLQFRAEFFNVLNHTNFDLPEVFFGSSTFGRISSAANARRIQFGLKLIF